MTMRAQILNTDNEIAQSLSHELLFIHKGTFCGKQNNFIWTTYIDFKFTRSYPAKLHEAPSRLIT